jgi:poly-gamma-glutamate synthesis protein (capsule biosynthesis protein)
VAETSDEQRTLGHELIDAGADVIIGTHSHCVQGIEYYKNRPIFYSLGSCWFNGKSLETFLVQLHFTGGKEGGDVTATLVPAMQENAELRLAASAAEAKSITDLILQYSAGVWMESYADEEQNGHIVAVLHEGEAPAGAQTVTAETEAPEGDGESAAPEAGTDEADSADTSAETGAAEEPAYTGDAASQDDAPAQG